MAKEVGMDRLGDFYTGGKVRKRREWRGFRDTMYDYWRWLHIMGTLAGFIIKPRNIKAMFRYRWMANYLAVPMMVDRHTQGLRRTEGHKARHHHGSRQEQGQNRQNIAPGLRPFPFFLSGHPNQTSLRTGG